jgi:hypothetical protein
MGGVSSPAPDTDPASGPPESTRRYRRTLSKLLVALLASWVLMLLPLPWSLLAGIAGIVTGVLLVMLVIAAVRDRRPGMAVLTAVVGLPAVLMIVLGSVTSLVFYGPVSQLEQCRDTALTQQAEDGCQDEVENSVVSWMEGLTGS